ncbi:MAG: peptidoglycan-associated lipoprotein Pal [Desulfobacteraceae bacterium]|nr:peptidoglycan-associated lipoprotein Pal [Desulfobacteraceae bacterium]MCF8096039.1 peptidoglycan-associated lipoprotein Pal [Desulfobacteraceae bacterium]
MVKRINIRFILFCILVLSLAAFVSCAKKPPESAVSQEKQQQVSETETTAEAEKTRQAQQEEEISEQELEARKRAEAKQRREKQKEEKARGQFLSEKVYFEFDDSSLTDDAREVLRRKSRWIRDNPDACIIIEGHCDERGTDEYNLALGSRRAESVKDFLVKTGVDASRLTTISYGEERPAVKGHNEDVWTKNRRAEFRFCSGK